MALRQRARVIAYRPGKCGGFAGVRCSTRPDAIDEERLELLKQHGFTAIELGAQCMDDGVLLQNGRGHTVQDVENASRLVKEYNFTLGLQMMTGLPGANDAIDTVTAKAFTAIKPDFVRIYPTLVLPGTRLWPSGMKKAATGRSLCVKLLSFAANCCCFFKKTTFPSSGWGCTTRRIYSSRFLPGPIIRLFGSFAKAGFFCGKFYP